MKSTYVLYIWYMSYAFGICIVPNVYVLCQMYKTYTFCIRHIPSRVCTYLWYKTYSNGSSFIPLAQDTYKIFFRLYFPFYVGMILLNVWLYKKVPVQYVDVVAKHTVGYKWELPYVGITVLDQNGNYLRHMKISGFTPCPGVSYYVVRQNPT